MRKTSGIFLFNNDNKFLIEHPTYHSPKFWSIPKGMIDEGESEFDAAIRETIEETSLDITKIKYSIIKQLPDYLFKSKKKTLVSFVLRTSENLYNFPYKCESMVTFTRGKKLKKPFPEVDKFKWATIDEAYPLLHETQKRALDFIKENELI